MPLQTIITLSEQLASHERYHFDFKYYIDKWLTYKTDDN